MIYQNKYCRFFLLKKEQSMTINQIIFLYILIINLLGFAFMGLDKFKARKNMWRIPEKTLFFLAVLGGSAGAILGMYTFRHKTRHWYFVYGMPAILILQIILIVYFTLVR